MDLDSEEEDEGDNTLDQGWGSRSVAMRMTSDGGDTGGRTGDGGLWRGELR